MTTDAPTRSRGLLIGSALLCLPALAGLGLVLLPPLSLAMWQAALVVLEFSALFALPALGGALLALRARRSVRGRGASLLAASNALLMVLALVPSVSVWQTARDEGVRLDPFQYAAGFATSADREPVTVEYASPEGEPLELDVWRPEDGVPEDSRLPVVVNVHGGAEDLPQSLLPRWDTWLADSGGSRVVFDVDYRYFPDGDWSASLADVHCALGWVYENAAEYGGDPERIALNGQSAGGLLVLLAAYSDAPEPSCDTEVPEVEAVVAWYSATDGTAEAPPVPWRQRRSPVGDELLESSERMVGGPPEEHPQEYEAMSPILQVDADSPPTLLITAGHDFFLGTEDNGRMVDRLESEGVPHHHVELPWTEHMFDLNWGGLASQVARQSIGDFLADHL
ncbi:MULTISPECIES: alpha/beta hydrolase [Nocardiopsis]|uniref:alpha/beta hydrolase n=1 Tax=Nocardiopsis TaxID=2013 RepID=UPI00034DA196|nr:MULTISPECIES: alpha/beta hydrolase [Nocardiopsis]PWV57411.1 acetyl esterase/lipase [Nocardiopsis sp. L17-MgMaSL7]